MISPPFGCSTWPTKNAESSLARKTKHGAISSGSAGRPSGTLPPNFSTSSGVNVEVISGVQTGPGATALTRMPRSTSESASERVNATTAPLVEA